MKLTNNKKEIALKNKLIAIFMGNEQSNANASLHDYYYYYGYKYHWNRLMPVVEKIESLDLKEYGYKWKGIDGETEYNNDSICVEIEQKNCWIYMNLSLDPMHTLNPISYQKEYDTKIEATFEAVVEFIEHYNIIISKSEE